MSSPFIQYRNIFGKPGKGIHKYKFLGTSIIDYLFTILFAIFITYLTDIPLILTTIGLLLLGIFFHKLFGIESHTIRYLGL